MTVVKILRRERELFQVANRPQFGGVDGRGGRLIRVLRERGRLRNDFAARSGNVSLQEVWGERVRKERGATVEENGRNGVGRVGDGREELVERQVGFRVHPADRFRSLDEENGVRDAVGKGGNADADFDARLRRRLKRGGFVDDARVNAAGVGGAGTAEEFGRFRVKLRVPFAVPRLVEADLSVKFVLSDKRQKENAPAVERFAVLVDRITSREGRDSRLLELGVGEAVRREAELFQVAKRPRSFDDGVKGGEGVVGDFRRRVLGEGGRSERRDGGEKRGSEQNEGEGGEEIASHRKTFPAEGEKARL